MMSRLRTVIKEFGFEHFGSTPLKRPLSFDLYEKWIAHEYHGSMTYLKAHAQVKLNPSLQWPAARSALVIGRSYVPHPYVRDGFKLQANQIALYAQGDDYHLRFQNELQRLIDHLKTMYPDHFFAAMSDSKPVLERDLAYQAGLGWVGKNTCLLNKTQGSLFWIGEILTNLQLEAVLSAHPDHCGTCTRCLDACPTQALVAPRTLDARRCISYLTIEAKDDPPEELRKQMGGWLFGCDICQTVCPWNQKILGQQTQSIDSNIQRELQVEELRWILESSNRTIERALVGTPLLRAGPAKLKRTALIVIANLKLNELRPLVSQVRQQHPRLDKIATWVMTQLEDC